MHEVVSSGFVDLFLRVTSDESLIERCGYWSRCVLDPGAPCRFWPHQQSLFSQITNKQRDDFLFSLSCFLMRIFHSSNTPTDHLIEACRDHRRMSGANHIINHHSVDTSRVFAVLSPRSCEVLIAVLYLHVWPEESYTQEMLANVSPSPQTWGSLFISTNIPDLHRLELFRPAWVWALGLYLDIGVLCL